MNKIMLTIILIIFSTAIYAQSGPVVTVDKNIYDLGDIKQNQVHNFEFKIRNTGNEELNIEKYRLSCSCLSIEEMKHHLAPGETFRLKGVFNSKEYTSIVERNIILYTNANNSDRVILTVKANIIEAIKSTPNNIKFFLKGEKQGIIKKQLSIESSSEIFSIKQVYSNVDFLMGKIVKNEGNTYTLDVALDTDKIPEFDFFYIVVRLFISTDNSYEKEKKINVYIYRKE